MYRAKCLIGLCLISLFSAGGLWAQPQGAVRGQVVESESGTPLPGVNVYIAFTSLGAATDSEGEFEIQDIPLGAIELVASMIGYETFTRKLVLDEEMPQSNVDIQLEASIYGLEGITVTATRDRYWRRNLRRFRQQFIGQSQNARDTRILNPEVLSFADTLRSSDLREAELFEASAREPLEIENRALGYHISYLLGDFIMESTGDWVRFYGLPYFEELEPESEKEAATWKKNREASFEGSLQHFLSAAVRNSYVEEGFVLHKAEYDPVERLYVKGGEIISSDSLIVQTEIPYEYRIAGGQNWILTYSAGLPGEEYPESLLRTSAPVTVHESGYVYPSSEDNGELIVSGELGLDRLADLLPRDYHATYRSTTSSLPEAYAEKEACQAWPDASYTWKWTSRTLPAAIRELDEHLEEFPEDLEARYKRGMLNAEFNKWLPFQQRNLERARADFEYVIAEDSLFRDVHYRYALSHLFHREYRQAIRKAHDQVRLNANHVHAIPGLMRAYRNFMLFGREKDVEAFLRTDSSDYGLFFQAELLRRRGRFTAADSLLWGLVTGGSSIPIQSILMARARIYFALDYDDIAQGFYNQAVQNINNQVAAILVFDQLKYIVNPEELAAFREICTAQDFRRYFNVFWNRRNPVPGARSNPRLAEHYRRLEKAEKDYLYYDYRELDSQGHLFSVISMPETHALGIELDDRGIVYMRHGEPDDYMISVGERIRLDGKLGGGPLPRNESWLYRNPDLVFHFLSRGAAHMRITHYVEDPSGTWYDDRSYWGMKLMGPPPSILSLTELEELAQKNVDSGLVTDRHSWPEEIEHLDISFMPAAFRGADGLTTLEVHYTLPVEQLAAHVTDDSEPVQVEMALALQHRDWTEAGLLRVMHTIDTAREPQERAVYHVQIDSPAAAYRAFFHGQSLANKYLRGAYSFDYVMPDYSSLALSMSDVLLAKNIEPAASGEDRYTRGDLRVDVAPDGAFSRDELVYLYFEIYNLRFGENDVTNYEIESQLSLADQERNILSRLMDDREQVVLSLSSEHQSSTISPSEYFAIDMSEVPKGIYDLEITIRDQVTKEETKRVRQLIID